MQEVDLWQRGRNLNKTTYQPIASSGLAASWYLLVARCWLLATIA